ncbi:CPBP family intramembrane metalloprotease [Sphingomonas sp. NBWT7]|uniref:CPBP family intramembrane glutamic endopeptidase n=1 Tax=Sphingomonas sp. NBWT7 TaxID=2596913 RepID=UPI001626D95B|nr:CPBP family intramembrane glutamic endopeptidase [Sphingomonas sp. NBWT7]QNE33057.1 CPBP family intramembrane metalloprotease [Sphingomonas sp. NBWT7]
MLAAALLAAAIGMIVYGWWRGRSIAASVARAVRGQSRDRRRATLGWAAGIAAMYGVTALTALALLGRLDALSTLPPELAAARALGIAPLSAIGIRDVAGAIAGGFLGGAILVALTAWRRRRTIDLGYRSSAIAASRAEASAALVLAAAAGFGEELFFRLAVPLLVAIVFGSGVAGCAVGWALFTIAHRYQGWRAMAAVGLVGLVLAWLYLATGSLWLVVLLHTIIDANALVIRPWLERVFARRDV